MDLPEDDFSQKARRARVLSSYMAAVDQPLGRGRPSTDDDEWDEITDHGDTPLPICCSHAVIRYCWIDEAMLPFKLLYIFFRGGIACISPYLSVFMSFMSMSPSTIGAILAIPNLITALVTPLCGILADRFNSRKVLLIFCLSLWILFIVCLNFVQQPEQAACRDMVSNLEEISSSLPAGSRQFGECLMNTSLDSDGGQGKPFLSLLYLPDPISSLDKTCAAMPATDVGDQQIPINSFRHNLKHFRELFLPRVMITPSSSAHIGIAWLFEGRSLLQTFVGVFVLLSLGEVMQCPTISLTDTATLNELGEQGWDKYGWQRSFGSAGFAVYAIAIAFFLGILRFPQTVCGFEIEVIDYRIGTVMFGGTVACSFGLLFACCFKFKYYTTAQYKFRNVLPAFFSRYYGSVMVTALVLAICNGCVNGYLFWHLRNQGATEITLSLVLAVRGGSELLLAFHTPKLIGCIGHVELLVVGLLAYFVRLVCYAAITNPWLVLPVEVLHGMSIALTWNVLVSFMCRSVPLECMATLQGFLSGIYFGLGQGIGVITSGFLVHAFGAATTFYGFSVAVLCYTLVFVLVFKSSQQPRKPVTSYQMLPSKDPPW